MTSADCPCGSGLAYRHCCEPVIRGKTPVLTAEALMRARYSAYAKVEIDFLRTSLQASDQPSFDPESTREWARNAQWQGLEILALERGGEADSDGIVEFQARYVINGEEQQHHERARFARENGRWVFVEGRVIGRDPYRRETPKVGRNEPCPCGSGRKYKKCCER